PHAFARPLVPVPVRFFLALVAEHALRGTATEPEDERVESHAISGTVLSSADDPHDLHVATAGPDRNPSSAGEVTESGRASLLHHLGSPRRSRCQGKTP